VRLEIMGPRTVAPGEQVQFRVDGRMSDGSTVDYSANAIWRSQAPDILSVEAKGLATGGAAGATVLSVTVQTISASTEIVVLPAATFRLSVVVTEASAPALDVRVEVISGVGTGLFDVMPVNGRYDLYGVAGPTEIRVSGNGYLDHLERVSVTQHTVVTVQMVPGRTRADVSGTYALVIEGDAACQAALPTGLATRRYTAVVTQKGPDVTVSLHGAEFGLFGLTRNMFTGRRDGASERIVFNLGGFSDTFYAYAYEPRPDVIEDIGDSTHLYFVGGAVTTVTRHALSGTFDGKIRHIQFRSPSWGVRLSECVSKRISFVLSR
jgi:hypothetical protein